MTGGLRHTLFGLGFMLFGSPLVLGAVLGMNALSAAPPPAPLRAASAFEVKKRERPRPKREVAPKPKPKPRRTPKAPPPPRLAALSAGLSGIDLGVFAAQPSGLGEAPGALLGDTGDVIHTSDTVDEPARAVAQTPIPYPPQLQRKGIEGHVVLSLLISATGRIEQSRVIESQPPGVFDEVALGAVTGWRFEAGRYQGHPVRGWVRQRISFDLR